MSIKFTLISDLHLDHPQPKTPYDLFEKNVVVAGDSTNGLACFKFYKKLKNKGFNVWAVDGNHEHYANVIMRKRHFETTAEFQAEFPPEGNIDGVPIVLVNGWYEVSDEFAWRSNMADFKHCGFSYDEINALAKRDAALVETNLSLWKDLDLKGIVVTHTAPCTETLDPRFAGQASNQWFWNRHMRYLMADYRDQILVWCHGHTHAFADKVVDGVRVVCNPRGYPNERHDWVPITIEV